MSQTLVDIGSLITSNPDIQGGRPIISGTGTSVQRIVALYKQGYGADEIVADKDYLTLAQVDAALAYYYANQRVIDGVRGGFSAHCPGKIPLNPPLKGGL
ncbi:DUF433 domain-containing protein [Lyngbya sp. CCY1209]|uniref:DUF433 domain-containing protein n=1 Tax=Lyngbya sp. CCY1209 TaxID=2886103 RepID=UPI002D1FCB92|nr:DUF433 domain-containing protein [Lyngbya sp. CCY1209]MEB3886793.1 DUF433 domain-containing protein [Lyngbya sp. CCY1209]